MMKISIDNGHSFCSPEEAVKSVSWDEIVSCMDDETREQVHFLYAPCSKLEFLTKYLELAENDLILG